MSNILNLIENSGLDLNQTESYAAILGESPSKGAKSPSLWNAAFDGLGVSGKMHPFDVTQDKLEQVVKCLRADSRFIGGAVTMPYKITIMPFLDEVEPEAGVIGAVNCIYRRGGSLVGTNTDGAGAIPGLLAEMGEELAGSTALLIGCGGAGYAVAAYLASNLGNRGTLLLSNRSSEASERLASRLDKNCKVETVAFPPPLEIASRPELIINCTSLGFEGDKKDEKGIFNLACYTPLGSVNESIRVSAGESAAKRYMFKARTYIAANLSETITFLSECHDPLVMDIVYQPTKTTLLHLAGSAGMKTLNGVAMNLEQAVIAFEKATTVTGLKAAGPGEVRALMKTVW